MQASVEAERASPAVPVSATEEGTRHGQNEGGGKQLEPLDLSQFKGQDSLCIVNQFQGDNAWLMLKMRLKLEDVEEVYWWKEKDLKEGFQNKIQPLDLNSKIQSSDHLVVSKERLVPTCEGKRGSEELDKTGGIGHFHGPKNLGFEFFSGPNPSGPQILNAMALDYQPIGLQSSGPLDQEGHAIGSEDDGLLAGQIEKEGNVAGPSGMPSRQKTEVGLEGSSPSSENQGLGFNGPEFQLGLFFWRKLLGLM